MRLDRLEDRDGEGTGKYALINLRRLNELCGHVSTFERWTPEVAAALETLRSVGALEWGRVGAADEFFVLKLKDVHAKPALLAYAESVGASDAEFARDVAELAGRAGSSHPNAKQPD